VTSAMQVLEQFVVVFSQNDLPLSQVKMKRVIVVLLTNKAEPLDLFADKRYKVYLSNLVLYVSKQIRLKIVSIERMWKVPRVNRREVSRRDYHSSQCCGSKHLTLDHVIPHSETWNNAVAACRQCNCRKGNQTSQKASMPLHTKPKALVHPAISFAVSEAWRNSAIQFWIDVQANLE
jgi:hypothetical protein